MGRTLTYGEALREATEQEMERDPSVIVLGIGVDDFKAVWGTTKGLKEKFGGDRCFDTPLAEDGMTGLAIGAALAGLRPIHVHIRMDFVLLAMNQIINIASKARYMYGGQVSVPIVVRSVIGRSWGQGAQHSLHLVWSQPAKGHALERGGAAQLGEGRRERVRAVDLDVAIGSDDEHASAL